MNTPRILRTAAPEAATSRCARASTAVPGGGAFCGGIGTAGAGTSENANETNGEQSAKMLAFTCCLPLKLSGAERVAKPNPRLNITLSVEDKRNAC